MKGALGIRTRRASAKSLLEAQLERGTKPEKINGKTTSNMILLSEKDKTRINKEIASIDKPKK